MSVKACRLAVRDYFNGGNASPLMQVVHKAKPRNWNDKDFALNAASGRKSAAVGYVYVEGAQESRIATGEKRLDYIMALIFQFRSWHSETDNAVDDFDDLVDALKAHARSDPTFGTTATGTIWQAAVQTLEHASEATQYDPTPQQKLLAFVRFDVTEMLIA